MTSTQRTPTKDLIRLAALRNCEGASCLAEEELEEAVANFTVAYHCIGQAIARDKEGEGDHDGDESEDEKDDEDCLPAEAVDRYHFILDTSEVAWYAASRAQEGTGNSNNASAAASRDNGTTSFFVAKEALVFPPESASNPSETPFFEAVILFNLALTFHQNGRQNASPNTTTDSRKSCLCRGLCYYTHCLRLLKEGNYDHSITSVHANRIVEAHLLIASLNNKAQTLFALQDYHEAFWMLQELGNVLDNTAGAPPGFKDAEVRGLEGTMELLNTPEMTAVQDAVMAARACPPVAVAS